MFFATLDEPTESEKLVMQTKSYISDAFDYLHEFQIVKTQNLWEYREFDRSLMPKSRGTQREYSSKPHKHSIVERTLVFKR